MGNKHGTVESCGAAAFSHCRSQLCIYNTRKGSKGSKRATISPRLKLEGVLRAVDRITERYRTTRNGETRVLVVCLLKQQCNLIQRGGGDSDTYPGKYLPQDIVDIRYRLIFTTMMVLIFNNLNLLTMIG